MDPATKYGPFSGVTFHMEISQYPQFVKDFPIGKTPCGAMIAGQTFRTNDSKRHCFFPSVRELSVISCAGKLIPIYALR
jgi:hypothetical protein